MSAHEQSVEIRVYAHQGQSIKAIAREIGLWRNTVRSYLRGGGLPRYTSQAPRPCKLAPFKHFLQERIEVARPHWIPATVLIRDIGQHSYTSGLCQLKTYLEVLKDHLEEPLVCFETPPGKQLQVHFTTIRRGRAPAESFVATLGFSRATQAFTRSSSSPHV